MGRRREGISTKLHDDAFHRAEYRREEQEFRIQIAELTWVCFVGVFSHKLAENEDVCVCVLCMCVFTSGRENEKVRQASFRPISSNQVDT